MNEAQIYLKKYFSRQTQSQCRKPDSELQSKPPVIRIKFCPKKKIMNKTPSDQNQTTTTTAFLKLNHIVTTN